MTKVGHKFACLNLTEFKTPEEYLKACDVDVRTSINKAKKLTYVIEELTEINEVISAQLYDIWTSTNIRQNRPINLNYELLSGKTVLITKEKWPISRYTPNNRMFVLKSKDKILCYLELDILGTIAIVHSTLGHADYLNNGIMKTLYFDVFKITWGNFETVVYGQKKDLNYFKKDLLFQ